MSFISFFTRYITYKLQGYGNFLEKSKGSFLAESIAQEYRTKHPRFSSFMRFCLNTTLKSMIHKLSMVTPTGGRAITYDEESWKPSPEDKSKEKDDLSRQCEVRQSKTKRVKNYLKKCKNALGNRSASLEVSPCSESPKTSSWYIENNLNECEINELEEVFEDAQVSPSLGDSSSAYQVANIIEVKGPSPSVSSGDSGVASKDNSESKGIGGSDETSEKDDVPEPTSPSLKESQDKEEGEVAAESKKEERKEEEDRIEIEIPIKLVS
ncbi:hypothetical protein NQ315_004060 [Exocentrus adspersus]|uniref:Uncharacterized protein n=1 Tax=Exocentrus adspersus TaxID=1586481 RepID=A0AAV8W677_9CUCU|nr:hypothetical protein NQ315_004060 [Exocentrus adspersus]